MDHNLVKILKYILLKYDYVQLINIWSNNIFQLFKGLLYQIILI